MTSNEDLETKFHKCVNFVQNLPQDGPYQSSNQEKLLLYSLFKQATEGENKTKKPSRFNIVAKTKWDSWAALGMMKKEDAMKKYINEIVSISKKIPGKQSEDFRKDLGLTAKL